MRAALGPFKTKALESKRTASNVRALSMEESVRHSPCAREPVSFHFLHEMNVCNNAKI